MPTLEIEYSDKNTRRSKVYIAVGLIMALLVGATVFLALQASGLTGDEEVVQRTVVVAAREIPARKAIEEADVAIRTVVADPTNAKAFATIDEVIGRVSGVGVGEGQLMTTNVLASTTSGQEFSILEPGEEFDPSMPDLRAISVNVPDERAVGGSLQIGQRIDLIATLAVNPAVSTNGGEEGGANGLVAGPTTKTTLQALEVLSRNGTFYILRADLGTAEQIAELVAAGAQFTLALRAEADDRVAETEGSTIDMLLEHFGFPAPEIADLEGR